MPTPTEIAARTYAAAWQEPDAAKRLEMIEACWATDGRLVTPSGGFRGRAALAKAMDAFRADPRGMTARIAEGSLDIQGVVFRFRSELEHRDGTIVPGFDAGEVDAEGRITTLITFNGPPP